MERIRKEKYLKDLEQQVQMRKEREEREKAKLQAEDRRVGHPYFIVAWIV